MGGYAVDMAELVAVESMLTDAASEARSQLRSLTASADALLARWHGAAGTDFRLGWGEWHAGTLTLIDALHDMAVAIGRSGRDYLATDTSVQATVTGTSS